MRGLRGPQQLGQGGKQKLAKSAMVVVGHLLPKGKTRLVKGLKRLRWGQDLANTIEIPLGGCVDSQNQAKPLPFSPWHPNPIPRLKRPLTCKIIKMRGNRYIKRHLNQGSHTVDNSVCNLARQDYPCRDGLSISAR